MERLRNKKHIVFFLAFAFLLIFQSINLQAQTAPYTTIHVFRERRFIGSGNKMNILINGKTVYRLKNGRHLIINSRDSIPLDFQIVYPVMKKIKSFILHFPNEYENEIYLLVSYKGGGASFRIDIKPLKLEDGKEMLKNYKLNKKKSAEIEIH